MCVPPHKKILYATLLHTKLKTAGVAPNSVHTNYEVKCVYNDCIYYMKCYVTVLDQLDKVYKRVYVL